MNKKVQFCRALKHFARPNHFHEARGSGFSFLENTFPFSEEKSFRMGNLLSSRTFSLISEPRFNLPKSDYSFYSNSINSLNTKYNFDINPIPNSTFLSMKLNHSTDSSAVKDVNFDQNSNNNDDNSNATFEAHTTALASGTPETEAAGSVQSPKRTSEDAKVTLEGPPRLAVTDPKKGLEELSKDEVIDDALHIPEVWGRVHSFESFSAVDGPSVRSVVFLQGCLRRCLFCANPDTWSPLDNCMRLSSKNIANRLRKNLSYYEGGGGVTLSGGEPMMQPHFCASIFKEAHALNITTCLDTAGYGRADDWAVVLPHTDRVLLCLKAMDLSLYQEIVGIPQFTALKFAKAVSDYDVPLIIRWVLMTGYTDTEKEIDGLVEFAKKQRSLVGIEVLPYHNLGKNKWAALNLKYPLEGMTPPSREVVERTRKKITDAGIRAII